MKKINWPLTILFAWLFLFLLAVAINQFETRFCTSAMLKALSKQQDVLLFNCFEFWFNRYQSLIGSMITASVAGYTLYWLVRQLKVADRQASVAAAQSLRIRTNELDAEDKIYDDLIRFATEHKDKAYEYYLIGILVADADQTYTYYRNAVSDIWSKTFKVREYMEIDPLGSRQEGYLDLLEALHDMADALHLIQQILSPSKRSSWGQTSSSFFEASEFAHLRDRAEALDKVATTASEKLHSVRLDTWIQVRKFEASAVSGA